MKNNILKSIVFYVDRMLFPKLDKKEAEDLIVRTINIGNPCMIARLGAVESKGVLYKMLPWPFYYLLKRYVYTNMQRNAGFFPLEESQLHRFCDLMKQDMKEVDILGSWRPEEAFFCKYLRNSKKVTLGTIGGPHDTPYAWTQILKGKKILVVHPFADTILKQYNEKRELLFSNPLVLPEFKTLEAIKAVQTIAGNSAGFDTWFDALDYMKREIEKHDFDICLIGCGAYGFPLAAHVKRMGKQAIHIGGPLQLHFGIKGKRWDNSGLYNEHWVSPSENERPQGLKNVEGGCYW